MNTHSTTGTTRHWFDLVAWLYDSVTFWMRRGQRQVVGEIDPADRS